MIYSPQKKLGSVDNYILGKKNNLILARIIVYSLLAAIIAGSIFYLNFKNKKFQDSLNQQAEEEQNNLQNHWQALLAKSQKSKDELFYMGIDLAKKKLLSLSTLVLAQVVDRDPNWRDAAYYTGYVYLERANSQKPIANSADLEKAKEYLEKARAIDPIYAPTYELLAQVYQNLGDETNAQLCYNKSKAFQTK